jgi:hypothetical protein
LMTLAVCARTLSAKPPWRPTMVAFALAHILWSPTHSLDFVSIDIAPTHSAECIVEMKRHNGSG